MKGVSTFQIFLMATMILGAIIGNNQVILFSMTMCLIGYIEPNCDRFHLKIMIDEEATK